MTHFKNIYATQAAAYDRMVSFEDYQKNINRFLLDELVPKDQIIVDLGAGTGRLSRILAPIAKKLIACDISPHMLAFAKTTIDHAHCDFIVADNRYLPLASNSVDVVTEGWSIGHSVGWYPHTWETEITKALEEIKRILVPNGLMIIFETMGTGSHKPKPPTEGLSLFYTWLENEHGFEKVVLQTDYQFPSVEIADQSTRFFFGDELADNIKSNQLTILPEWTGVWWKRV